MKHRAPAPSHSAIHLQLNTGLLRERISNVPAAARQAGLRPATVYDLIHGKTALADAKVGTVAALATVAGCAVDDLIERYEVILAEPASTRPDFATMLAAWRGATQTTDGTYPVGPETALEDVERSRARARRVPADGEITTPVGPYAI
jgi:hypothetical protein